MKALACFGKIISPYFASHNTPEQILYWFQINFYSCLSVNEPSSCTFELDESKEYILIYGDEDHIEINMMNIVAVDLDLNPY